LGRIFLKLPDLLLVGGGTIWRSSPGLQFKGKVFPFVSITRRERFWNQRKHWLERGRLEFRLGKRPHLFLLLQLLGPVLPVLDLDIPDCLGEEGNDGG
jgi:hypothetical protein